MRVKTTISAALIVVVAGVAMAEEPVAGLDFDQGQPKYMFSYGFAGYGDFSGAESQLNDQMKVSHKLDPQAGIHSRLLRLKQEYKQQRSQLGNQHPAVKALAAEMKQIEQKQSGALTATLDSSELKVPDDISYDYAGWGVGACYDLTEKPLPLLDFSKYAVAVDAKVAGTEPLTQSKLNLRFVVPDGQGPLADDDDHDDVVLELGRGSDDGTNTFEINNEYQTIQFRLDRMTVKSGKKSDLEKYKLSGLVFIVQAQGDAADIGVDKDNVLSVDNVRLVPIK